MCNPYATIADQKQRHDNRLDGSYSNSLNCINFQINVRNLRSNFSCWVNGRNARDEEKTHVEKGIGMLSPVGAPCAVSCPLFYPITISFDGSGYHATKGLEIPIEARIISLADVFDSLVSDRPHRKGMSL
jgi:hypothetical protein